MTLLSAYSLGLFFIFLVAVIWSIASIVVQYLYTDQHFDSPFLLTYIGTSLFVMLLISRLLYERRHKLWFVTDDDEEVDIIPWKTHNTYQQVASSASEIVSLEHVQIDYNDKQRQSDHSTTPDICIWSHEQHMKVAIRIAPVWFLANYAYNSSLAYASITSSTVLASTGSLFTFLFAVLCGDEGFTVYKLMGVLLGVTGSILTGLHDLSASPEVDDPADDVKINSSVLCVAGPSGTPHHIRSQATDAFAGHAVWGDALGLLSAVGYGAYAVMIRIMCPRDERLMSMQLLLGYIGLINCVILSPVALYIVLKPLLSTSTATKGLTWLVFGYLVAKGTLDNVLSDYLWARAVVLTSATVATVGLGLTIPFAFVCDWIMGHGNVVSAQSILGALAVLAGFVLVSIGEKGEAEHADPIEDVTPGVMTTTSSDVVSTISCQIVASSSSEIMEDDNQAR